MVTQLTEERPTAPDAGLPDPVPEQPAKLPRSAPISVRFMRAGQQLRLIVRAAKRRGVHPTTYIRERALACAIADLKGEKKVDLKPLD